MELVTFFCPKKFQQVKRLLSGILTHSDLLTNLLFESTQNVPVSIKVCVPQTIKLKKKTKMKKKQKLF